MKTLAKNHKRVLIPIIMFVIMFTSLQTKASDEATLNEEIQEASLIIKAKLINKYYSKEETIVLIGTGAEIKEKIVVEVFTIFNFSVVDVLKGKYRSPEIEVRRLGGCNDEVCSSFVGLDFDYEENEEAVLFLIPRELDKSTYRTTKASDTAFVLDDEKILRRKSEFYNNYDDNIVNDNNNTIILNSNNKFMINNEYKINYEELKVKINEVESNESH